MSSQFSIEFVRGCPGGSPVWNIVCTGYDCSIDDNSINWKDEIFRSKLTLFTFTDSHDNYKFIS